MSDTLDIPRVDADEFADDAIPPLQPGDNLDADEFLRRYEGMPEECRAELIGGIVYIMPPVSHADHGRPHSAANYTLAHYASFTPQVDAGDNSTTRLDLGDVPQPDLLLRIEEEAGGQSRMVDRYVEGSPELVIEIAASSASIDLNQKLAAYLRSGVREYVVYRTLARKLDWFVLNGNTYDTLPPDPADGLLKSRVFPGLWLDREALFRRNLKGLRNAVEAGCETREHQAFVERLREAAGDTE